VPTSPTGSPSFLPLLDIALDLLRSVEPPLRPNDWAIGGGTVLMWRYQHRASRDIDVFLKNPQLLPHLSPRLNERANAVAADYVEASNYLKLTRPEGEIDFIVAPDLTERPREHMTIEGRHLITETSVEIVVKKAFYRAVDFRLRDVFDCAVVLQHCGDELRRNASVLRSKKAILRTRTDYLRTRFAAGAATDIAVMPAGQVYLAGAVEAVSEFFGTL
jgi:Nucleotidyl transferase AbiEii toxin, Type IV TA system